MSSYVEAFHDWLACAVAGRHQPATEAMTAAIGKDRSPRSVASILGTAGHVLDFDDTYLPGIAHLSGVVAPAVLALGAERGEKLETVLAAYESGFEAMASFSRACYPGLYKRGFHATAACGPVGAAVGCAKLLDLNEDQRDSAIALALFRAGGMQASFGTDGKAIGVGNAAAAGVESALQAEAGASADLIRATEGFEEVTGGTYLAGTSRPAIELNWIKAYPCCLQTHGTIEAALEARAAGITDPHSLLVRVHPVSRRAAKFDDVADGLQAKFSIPYLAAFTILRGTPDVGSFDEVDEEVRQFARTRIRLETDGQLLESETTLVVDGDWVTWVTAALGSPDRPMDAETLAAKIEGLSEGRLDGALDNLGKKAADLIKKLDIP